MQQRTALAAVAAASLTFGLVACSTDEVADTATSASAAASSAITEAAAEFPRTVDTLDGQGNEVEVTIESQPQNIYATSVTLAGNLLALGAPVKNIAVQGKDNAIADERGFFKQWADAADAAGAEVGYEGEPDVEAILAAQPDLVVMSAAGQDTATSVYDQLADVVPVIVVDYSDKTWQETLDELAEATGLEDKADEVEAAYEAKVEEVKAAITAPEQPVNILSLGQGGETINVWTDESAQGRLLSDLGWDIAEPDESLAANDRFKGRSDVVSIPAENFAPALTGLTILGINADGKKSPKEFLEAQEQLNDNEALKAGRVYDMPASFFRIDYYSALSSLDAIKELFS